MFYNKGTVMTVVFLCVYRYARALHVALGDPLIEPYSVPGFYEEMIIELHEQNPNSVPAYIVHRT